MKPTFPGIASSSTSIDSATSYEKLIQCRMVTGLDKTMVKNGIGRGLGLVL